ncbi:MAG TPA: hypothetical protein VFZ07_08995, partial [Dongiaceae bacterium]
MLQHQPFESRLGTLVHHASQFTLASTIRTSARASLAAAAGLGKPQLRGQTWASNPEQENDMKAYGIFQETV